MRVLMTGGGSAGHITPILSVASKLKAEHPRCEIRYVGQRGDDMRAIVAQSSSIDVTKLIFAGKWRRYHGVGLWAHVRDWRTILKNLRDLLYFAIGGLQSLSMLILWRPDVVFVKGGFVGLPVGLAAVLLRVPLVTHDSDALPGLTNRILARFAAKTCVGLPKQYYPSYRPEKTVQTGTPIRENYVLVDAAIQKKVRSELGIPQSAKVVSVVGGSLGAQRLNEAITSAARSLLSSDEVFLLHIAGKQNAVSVESSYNQLPSSMQARLRVWAFLDEVYVVTAAADVVVSRAGATSIAELAAQAKPTVLVPNPYLVGGHQSHNARLVEQREAAVVVSESKLTAPEFDFAAFLTNLLADKKKQHSLSQKLLELHVPDAAGNLAAVLVEVAK